MGKRRWQRLWIKPYQVFPKGGAIILTAEYHVCVVCCKNTFCSVTKLILGQKTNIKSTAMCTNTLGFDLLFLKRQTGLNISDTTYLLASPHEFCFVLKEVDSIISLRLSAQSFVTHFFTYSIITYQSQQNFSPAWKDMSRGGNYSQSNTSEPACYCVPYLHWARGGGVEG